MSSAIFTAVSTNYAASCCIAKTADGRPIAFVFVGDYIDRGPHSSGVIDCLIDLKRGTAKASSRDGKPRSDGACCRSTRRPGAAVLAQVGWRRCKARRRRAGELPRAHVDWLRTLPLSYDDGRRFLSMPASIPLRRSTLRTLRPAVDQGAVPFASRRLWPPDRSWPYAAGGWLPDLRGNRLNLDTGAVFGGPLTAAVFDDAQTEPIRFLQAE